MNKREQAEMDTLRQQLAEARALRWSGLLAPQRLPLPQTDYCNGWNYNAYQNGVAYKAWTDCVHHGHRDAGGKMLGASPGSQRLYATLLDALIGLRLAKELECAKVLATIDGQIEAERGVS